MAKKKAASVKRSVGPRSFSGLVKGRTKAVQELAKEIRAVILEELPDAEESFYAGKNPMAMYRTVGEICWLQPLTARCNLYFLRGTELSDEAQILEGTSLRNRHVKIKSVAHLQELPIRGWLKESIKLNEAAIRSGLSFDQVLEKLRAICLALPQTKETLTWGKPHFRVGEKIFCGCSEQDGGPRVGLKMEVAESIDLMNAPGVEKAPYSRPNDGWVQIDPNQFDDWEEIERLIHGSFCLIAPKRVRLLLDSD